jgi:hypothetical protein
MAEMPILNVTKPLGLSLNREQAALLLKGLESLPPANKNNVLYEKLRHELEYIVVIWDRRIKNERIIQDQRRSLHKARKDQKSSPQRKVPLPRPHQD